MKELWLKHSKGDINFAHTDFSNNNNFVFVNIYGARGGNIADFSLPLGSIKKLRDWMDKILEDRSLPTPPAPSPLKPWQKRPGQLEQREQQILAYQSDREIKEQELIKARQKIEELEKRILDMKKESWWDSTNEQNFRLE